jgi:hypothetical protein
VNLKRGLVIVLVLSAVVFTGGVALEQRAEPGSSETVLGINPESPGLVASAIVLSGLLAIAASLRLGSLILAVAGAFGLIFAFLDTLEILHQLQEHRPSIAAIAGIAALFHLGITTLAIILMRRGFRGLWTRPPSGV